MHQLVAHHLDSYESMLWRDFPNLIAREKPIEVKGYVIKFESLYYEMPVKEADLTKYLTPAIARRQDLTYQAAACCVLNVVDPHGRETIYPRLELCKLPVMVGSSLCWTRQRQDMRGECPLDPGGYFIIKGKERVIIPHIRPAYDHPVVHEQEGPSWLCEFRSVNPLTQQSVLVQARTDCRRSLEFSLPYIKQYVPVGTTFKALGKTAEEAVALCGLGVKEGDSFSCHTSSHQTIAALIIEQYSNCPEDALQELAKYVPDTKKSSDKREYVKTVLNRELFLHGGHGASHLGWMVKKLAQTAAGISKPLDRDDIANKRVDTTGHLIMFLLDGLLKQYVKLFLKSAECQKNLCPYTVLQNSQVITNSLHLCFATGNWTVKRIGPPSYVRVGVSQILSNNNFGAKLSHLRRIMHAVSFKGKNIKMRQLHTSHYGFLCPYETPEGERVGIVLNMAESAAVSDYTPREEITAILDRAGGMPGYEKTAELSHLAWSSSDTFSAVVVDGRLAGFTTEPREFVKEAKIRLSAQVGVCWDKIEDEIHLLGCEGRFMRRMLDPARLRGEPIEIEPLSLSKTRTVTAPSVGRLEEHKTQNLSKYIYLCIQEINCGTVGKDYLDPPASEILTDVMSAVIPFYDHTQSPRNAYQSNMGKQAIGFPAINCEDRYDATLHRLDYPQSALTESRAIERVNFDTMAHGALPVVAIMTAEGFNQEDSIVLNASSLDRGLFSCVTYRTFAANDKRRSKYDSEQICLPEYGNRNKDWDYTLLDENGVINPALASPPHVRKHYVAKNKQESRRTGGALACACDTLWIPAGTVIIGKVAYRQGPTGTTVCKDISLAIKASEEGYLDKIVQDVDPDGRKIVKVRLRTPRIPEMGDKFASFTAQKGTCGAVKSQEDMPFDKDGVVPDLIINPHAFPSRMTVNYLLQMCFGLAGCKLGKRYDATAFERADIVKDIADAAKEAGIEHWDSVMYSGITGRRFPAKIFMAPCPYQRLRHMVSGKIHSRVSGPVDALTRQPVAGRSRDGGIKIGEMEQWCKISHGASESLKESMFDTSDKYSVPVCQTCGRISDHFEYCRLCDAVDIRLTYLPYTTKLLFQELKAIGISITFK
ncbi:DNA-directed RNA polymerase II second largest subunit [Singapore grouper iridovirus]|uniref:DNA-directed RNA polymerase subunit beta n=1 Tax=Singapore grouper iridovirus TaxID=262968 RepID=Q5YFJ2_9VIRU|nr:DNA-directed RNA polymerase II second largest subunit [Singapore grouper iridovirus]AAS18088.1 DNA-directed RNA polymerase II second largest subunit [Singapore grouper iridovirus]WAU86782.1 DNA-directed RNA polymerase II second largest subunit [Singapore grouper iridovirus]